MLFGKRKCDNCQENVDIAYERCPHCLRPFSEGNFLRYKNNLTWMPIPHELSLFLIGLFGLTIISVIVELIFAPLFQNNTLALLTLVNSVSYVALIIIMAIIILTNRKMKYFSLSFTKYRSYFIGLGFGVLLIVVSFVYSYLVSLGYQTSGNVNQNISVKMIKQYPLVMFFIIPFIGPICEELAYRLGLFTFMSRVNRIAAYAITIVIFSLIHFDFQSNDLINEAINLPQYMIAAFILSFTYEKYGLSSSMTAHIVNNLVSYILILAF